MSALAVPGTGLKAIDSLSANEFAVEVDGERVDGIFRVSNLVSFKLDIKTTTALKPIKEAFKVVKMVQRNPNTPINRWIRETVGAKADIVRPQRTLTILAVDDGVEIRRWTVNGAWISGISYSEFNTGSGELVEETLTIEWDSIDESWPAG